MVTNPDYRPEKPEGFNPLHDLQSMAMDLENLYQREQEDEISRPLEDLKAAAEEVGKASSGSWLGYHANVYYRGLQTPPPGAHFSREWGMAPSPFLPGSREDWLEYNSEDIVGEIHNLAGNPELEPARAFYLEAKKVFQRSQREVASILEVAQGTSNSEFLAELKQEAENLSFVTQGEIIQTWHPRQTISRDRVASGQGHWIPPHFSVLSEVCAIQHTTGTLTRLAEVIRQVQAHLTRQGLHNKVGNPAGTRVFIGHGQSSVWRELKEFVEDRLGLVADEFNRVSPAGIPTTERLGEMLQSAGFAFLIMTAEDEQADGRLRARENVVHEVGLFQASLGFKKAIVLLEEGCQEFSNIIGLGQIRFPPGNIRAAFEDVRLVLEREGILNQGATP